MMMSQLVALVFVTSALHLLPRRARVEALDACEAGCRCKADGVLRTADCSDLGLTDAPANINVLTTYLDLSMNDFTTLPVGAFSRLKALRELRLAGNKLNALHKHAFAGLVQLQVLTLQNNHLSQVPTESLKNLRNLRSLRLDANTLSAVPRGSFKGLASLRYLWMDDNRLTQVPAAALASLPALQALTLALNRISHLPDLAFHALRHLLVLHLHNNQIASFAERCFDGLHNLETLDLSSNTLDSFPTVIRALPSLHDLNLHSNNIKSIPEHAFTVNPSLETINLHNNPVRSIGKTSFQNLPELLTLSLSGTSSITRFPDLAGTSSVETLSITGTHISELPSTLCEDLPELRQLDLSHNRILSLPCFTHCQKIQKIDLRHNSIHEIQTGTFRKMSELSSLDLSFNRLSHLPLREELSGLTRLSVAGNRELRDPLPPHLLPRFRPAGMPCARPGTSCPMCPCRTENGDCALRGPTGPEVRPPQHHRVESRRPAHHLLAPGLFLQIPLSSPPPWAAHFCAWAIFIPSIGLNCLVLTLVLLPAAAARRITAARRLLLAALFCLRLLTGLCGAVLALAGDPQSPADLPAPWAPRRRGSSAGELAVLLSSQACVVVLMTAAAWEQRELRAAAPGARRLLGAASPVLVAVVLGCSAALAVPAAAAAAAAAHEGRAHPWEHTALGRVALNCGGYLLLTAVHLLLLCGQRRDESSAARRPRPAGPTPHGRAVTGVLLADTLLAVAEALLWAAPGGPPRPAGGSPSLLLAALPAVLDPLLYTLLLLHRRDPRVGRPGDGKH